VAAAVAGEAEAAAAATDESASSPALVDPLSSSSPASHSPPPLITSSSSSASSPPSPPPVIYQSASVKDVRSGYGFSARSEFDPELAAALAAVLAPTQAVLAAEVKRVRTLMADVNEKVRENKAIVFACN
jgi:hypothetical protein